MVERKRLNEPKTPQELCSKLREYANNALLYVPRWKGIAAMTVFIDRHDTTFYHLSDEARNALAGAGLLPWRWASIDS